VPGTLELGDDLRSLTFVPSEDLLPDTDYTLNVSNLSDVAGNAQVAYSQGFSTGVSSVADVVRPTLSSVTPVNGSTDIAADVEAQITFSERVNPLTLEGNIYVQKRFDGTVNLPGALSVSADGLSVNVKPDQPLLPGGVYRVVVSSLVEDLSGNRYASGSTASTFTVSEDAPVDSVAPSIVLVSPQDGATDIGLLNPIVVSFSEVLDPTTVSGNTFNLFANGQRLSPSVSRSSDNRTVTLSRSLPADSEVSLVISSGVTDLAGNALADFSTSFNTGAAQDASTPFVISQRPHSGAVNVPEDQSIVLYTNKSLLISSIDDALLISQNGVLVDGTTSVTGDGRGIEFIPDVAWENEALIQIFLTDEATDVSGNTLRSYQGSFRVQADSSQIAPSLVRVSTNNFFGSIVPLNPMIEFEYNKALDSASIGAPIFRKDIDGSTVANSVSLVGDRIIRVVPDAALDAETSYSVFYNTQISDLDGQSVFGPSTNFMTGTQLDTTPSMVELVSPPAGATNVPVNAGIRVRFNESINPISVTDQTILVSDGSGQVMPCTISFSNDNRDVQIVPHSPLAGEVLFTMTIDGVTDQAGNSVLSQTTQFTTGSGVDTDRPLLMASSPFSGSGDVPVNSPILIEVDEPLDPVTIDLLSVSDNTTGQRLTGALSLSSDGRVLSFAPDSVFGVGRSHSVYDNGIADLANNQLFTGVQFTTAFEEDATAPTVEGISPQGGLSGVQTNAQVVVRFDEPIQSLSADEVSLSAAGETIEVIRLWSDGNRLLTLTPTVPLDGAVLHTVTVTAEVSDTAGNKLAAEVTSQFTTGVAVDLVSPGITTVVPENRSEDVPTNAIVGVEFSKRINPLTVTESTFWLERTDGGTVRIEGEIVVAADGLSATITPTAPLEVSSSYRVRLTSGVRDLAGLNNTFFSVPSSFTTGSGPLSGLNYSSTSIPIRFSTGDL